MEVIPWTLKYSTQHLEMVNKHPSILIPDEKLRIAIKLDELGVNVIGRISHNVEGERGNKEDCGKIYLQKYVVCSSS